MFISEVVLIAIESVPVDAVFWEALSLLLKRSGGGFITSSTNHSLDFSFLFGPLPV